MADFGFWLLGVDLGFWTLVADFKFWYIHIHILYLSSKFSVAVELISSRKKKLK